MELDPDQQLGIVPTIEADCDGDISMDIQEVNTKIPTSSSKIHSVIENLIKLEEEKRFGSAPTKRWIAPADPHSTFCLFMPSLVFSFWTTTLDSIECALSSHGMTFARIDGSLSLPQRIAAIKRFQSDPALRIMLLSFGSGSVGYANPSHSLCVELNRFSV